MTQADIILQQLGGRRFIVMTGSKNLFHTNEGKTLSMHLTKNVSKAKYLQITLNDKDLYDMVFTGEKGRGFNTTLVEVAKYEDVYCDMLQDVFTKVTGLYTSL